MIFRKAKDDNEVIKELRNLVENCEITSYEKTVRILAMAILSVKHDTCSMKKEIEMMRWFISSILALIIATIIGKVI